MNVEELEGLSWVTVDSSNLDAVAMGEDTMYIRFNGGRVYAYTNISPTIYADLIGADSVGRYFNANIKGHYEYEEIEA